MVQEEDEHMKDEIDIDQSPIIGDVRFDIPLSSPVSGNSVSANTGRFDSSIPYREIEGRRPKSQAELIDKIDSLFTLDPENREQFEMEFQATRMVKGFFLCDFDRALKFHDVNLEGFFSIESFMANWDRVKAPSWLMEGYLLMVPMSWDHEMLDHPRNAKTRIRQMAGVSYNLQMFWGDRWFLMDQNLIADVIGRTQQDVSNCICFLVNRRWLKVRKMAETRCNEYRCQAALEAMNDDD